MARIDNDEIGGGEMAAPLGGPMAMGSSGPGGDPIGDPPGGDPPTPPSLPDVEIFYYHNNHLGTPLVMTDTSKTERWIGKALPFGKLYDQQINSDNYLRFPGQWEDGETDLHYNWHRYYDPEIGRYYQADPIGLAGGINMYSYVGGNPINYTDPYGLYSWGEFSADLQTFSYAANPSLLGADLLGGYVASLLPEGLRKGTWFGTGYGEDAVDCWASKYNKTGSSLAWIGGVGASLWTEDTWFGTASILAGSRPTGKLAGVPRSYWQYYPKGNPGYRTNWLAGSPTSKAPYALGRDASRALNLPKHNNASAVRRVNVRWYQPVRGPKVRKPRPDLGWTQPGLGVEYYRGWLWPSP